MKKPGFFESKIAAIEINANSVIGLGGSRGKIRVVTVRHEQVHQAVLVEIGKLEAGVSPTGLLLEDQVFREMSLAIAGENEHRLLSSRFLAGKEMADGGKIKRALRLGHADGNVAEGRA